MVIHTRCIDPTSITIAARWSRTGGILTSSPAILICTADTITAAGTTTAAAITAAGITTAGTMAAGTTVAAASTTKRPAAAGLRKRPAAPAETAQMLASHRETRGLDRKVALSS